MADTTKTIEIIVDSKKAVKETDKLTKSLKGAEDQTKETTEETEKYDKQLDDTSEATGALTNKLDKMTGGLFSSVKAIGASVKALKTFKIALAATGIGAIIVAIGSLITMFKNSEEGQDRWNKIIRVTGTVIDNVVDKFAALGEIVYEALVNPVEAAQKAWEGIKNFFTDPLGTIKAGYEAVTKAGKDFVKEVKDEIEVGQELADLEAETNKLERALFVERAERTAKIAELRRQAAQVRDEDAAAALELNKQAIEQAEALAKAEEDVARRRFEIKQRSNELSASTKEDLDEEARLEAELISVQTTSENLLRRLYNEQLTLNREVERGIELRRKQITTLQELEKKGIEFAIKAPETIEKINKIAIESTEENTEAQNDLNDALGVTADAAKGVLDIFQGKVQGKDIFKTVLKTLSGILSIVLPGSGAAIGGISSLLGGLFADGGYTKKGGKYEPAGIVHAGEWVANQELVNNPVTGPIIQALEEMRTGLKGYADGGFVASQTSQEAQIAQLAQTFQQQQIVLPIEDLRTVNTRVVVTEDRATL